MMQYFATYAFKFFNSTGDAILILCVRSVKRFKATR